MVGICIRKAGFELYNGTLELPVFNCLLST